MGLRNLFRRKHRRATAAGTAQPAAGVQPAPGTAQPAAGHLVRRPDSGLDLDAVERLRRDTRLVLDLQLEHQLEFPDEHAARRAAGRLAADGFRAGLHPGMGQRWLVLATHVTRLSSAGLGELEAYMQEVAAADGGVYDGMQPTTWQ